MAKQKKQAGASTRTVRTSRKRKGTTRLSPFRLTAEDLRFLNAIRKELNATSKTDAVRWALRAAAVKLELLIPDTFVL